MIATILLIVLMVVAVATSELIMRCSSNGKESVESPGEIVGD
jgi:flagellar basal body-associated protein FliL